MVEQQYKIELVVLTHDEMDLDDATIEIVEDAVERAKDEIYLCGRDVIVGKNDDRVGRMWHVDPKIKREFCEWVLVYLGKSKNIDISYMMKGAYQGKISHIWIQIGCGKKTWIVDPFASSMGRSDLVVSVKRLSMAKKIGHDPYELGITMLDANAMVARSQYIGDRELVDIEKKIKADENRGVCSRGLELFCRGVLKNANGNDDHLKRIVVEICQYESGGDDGGDFMTDDGLLLRWLKLLLEELFVMCRATNDYGKNHIEGVCNRLDKLWSSVFQLNNIWTPHTDIFFNPIRIGGSIDNSSLSNFVAYMDILKCVRSIGEMTDQVNVNSIRKINFFAGKGTLGGLLGSLYRSWRNVVSEGTGILSMDVEDYLWKHYPSCIKKAFATFVAYQLKLYFENEKDARQLITSMSSYYEIWVTYFPPELQPKIARWFSCARECRFTANMDHFRYAEFWQLAYTTEELDQAIRVRISKNESNRIEREREKLTSDPNKNSDATLTSQPKDRLPANRSDAKMPHKSGTKIIVVGPIPDNNGLFFRIRELTSKTDDDCGNDTIRIMSVFGNRDLYWDMKTIKNGLETSRGCGCVENFLRDFSVFPSSNGIDHFELTPSADYRLESTGGLDVGSALIPFLEYLYGKKEPTRHTLIRHVEWAITALFHPNIAIQKVYVPWPIDYQLSNEDFKTNISQEEQWIYMYSRVSDLGNIFANLSVEHNIDFHFMSPAILEISKKKKLTMLGEIGDKTVDMTVKQHEQRLVNAIWEWIENAEDGESYKVAELTVSKDFFCESAVDAITRRRRPYAIMGKHFRSEYGECKKLFSHTLFYGMSFIVAKHDQFVMTLYRDIMGFFNRQVTSALQIMKDNMSRYTIATSKFTMSRGFMNAKKRDEKILAIWAVSPWSKNRDILDIYLDEIRTSFLRILKEDGYAIVYSNGRLYLKPTIHSMIRDCKISLLVTTKSTTRSDQNIASIVKSRFFDVTPEIVYKEDGIAVSMPRSFIRWFEESFLMFSDAEHSNWKIVPFSIMCGKLVAFGGGKKVALVDWLIQNTIDSDREPIMSPRSVKQRKIKERFGPFEVHFNSSSFTVDSKYNATHERYENRRKHALNILTEHAERDKDDALSKERIVQVGKALACYRFYDGMEVLKMYPEVQRYVSDDDYASYVIAEYHNHHDHHPSVSKIYIYFPPSILPSQYFTDFDISQHFVLS